MMNIWKNPLNLFQVKDFETESGVFFFFIGSYLTLRYKKYVEKIIYVEHSQRDLRKWIEKPNIENKSPLNPAL